MAENAAMAGSSWRSGSRGAGVRRGRGPAGRSLCLAIVAVVLGTFAGGSAGAAAPLAPTHRAAAGACALPKGSTEGVENWQRHLRPAGTLRAIMLFVDFPDAAAAGDLADYSAELLPGGPRWFSRASYGRVHLAVTTVDAWVDMPHDTSHYAGYSTSFDAQRDYIVDAMHAAVVQQGVDFTGFKLIYVVPTTAATSLPTSPAFVAGSGGGASTDGFEIDYGATFGQDMWFWGFKVLDHETGHTFGLPDLYAFQGSNDHRFVGGWDLMGLISGPAPDYLALEKWRLGWLDPAQVACVNERGTSLRTLTPLERAGGKKLLVLRTGTATAVVVEDRQALGNDARTCSTGALIYEVDSSVATGHGPVRVENSHPGFAGTSTCGPLDHATFGVGPGAVSEFHDDADGITVHVLGITSTGNVQLRVRRATAFPPTAR